MNSYEQLAMGIKKPPSAKSAASRFIERNTSPSMQKLTKESLQELQSQIQPSEKRGEKTPEKVKK